MEIKITTKQLLKFLYVLSWIIFVGVCIEAGGFIWNSFHTLAINPANAKNFWLHNDLSGLYEFDKGYFFVETFVMSLVAVLRCCIFYLIIKILHEEKLNFAQPFNADIRRFIITVSYLAIVIGLFSVGGVKYAIWFEMQGVNMPDIEKLRLGGADVWLFMGVILFIIAQIYKRGIEIQTENDLTV